MVKIIDCTLREGNQARQCNFNADNSYILSKEISSLGIDMIEAGHPLISSDEFLRVKTIINAAKVPVLAHARSRIEDIDATIAVGAKWIGLFASINEISLATKFKGKSKQEVLDMFAQAITYSKSKELNVRATIEDASRTEIIDVIEMINYASRSGADRICYSDSVGALSPKETYDTLSLLVKKFPNITFEYHVHNDLGLSLANTLAAIDAGIEWISTSCNGIGERAGITDTLQLINFLYKKNHVDRFNILKIPQISKLVEIFSRIKISPMSPIVGVNAFNHVSRLHQLAASKNDNAYNYLTPSDFNLESTFIHDSPIIEKELFLIPFEKSATELKHHREGPGVRYVMIDKRLLEISPYYFIARKFNHPNSPAMPGHVDGHTHNCDSVFLFLGNKENYEGLCVEVILGCEKKILKSPATVFIPAGMYHTYRHVSGEGTYINFVNSGDYNSSLL
ncbi:LeuA family protein [Acinetobacter rudis]|uniref:2-isopropylmalate synthase n=1 Tax=Acinetobacter rudis CIP 110305 TaxID=421052 RepID=S3N1E7_9GAMM|nr:LeuA family protein [Acinetobacter rudis]EPF73950.1 2-isopropylmalate synthase [Acinetobacter rudis CIP 110305]